MSPDESIEFMVSLRRRDGELVGLKTMPIHALEDGCFKNYKVLGVSGVIERVNQVTRKYPNLETQEQLVLPGDFIVSVNGKTDETEMKSLLHTERKLWLKVRREPHVETSTDPLQMYVAIEYDAKEPELGYLAVARGQTVQVLLSTRTSAEERNTYKCDYVFGWHMDKSKDDGGWLPIDVLRAG
ncbi:unnamed protein product [Durusdinium trenchii]|uniref:PDZ domain-containing protein n=2 Tax=Durusdinium trenchii TaxID=1381693 RepID=A0ABP0NG67_9DINO